MSLYSDWLLQVSGRKLSITESYNRNKMEHDQYTVTRTITNFFALSPWLLHPNV
jgi:hypothetical protein